MSEGETPHQPVDQQAPSDGRQAPAGSVIVELEQFLEFADRIVQSINV